MSHARKAIIIGVAGLILFSFAAIIYILPETVVRVNGGILHYILKDYSFDKLNTPEKFGLDFKEFTTTSRDGLKLNSYFS